MSTKIAKLEVSNFLRLSNLVIIPKGLVLKVCGPNGAGKTSALKAIRAVNGGEAMAPAEPIREGEKIALIRETLENGNVVEKRWVRRRDGSVEPKLEIRDQLGEAQKKPQTLLDAMGKAGLDPLAFIRATPKEQMLTLRRISGCNLSDVENRHREAYENRREAGREVDSVRAVLEELGSLLPPGPRVDIQALLARQSEIVQSEGERARVTAARDAAEAEVRRASGRVADLEKSLAAAKAEEAKAQARLKEAQFDVESLPPPVDASALRAEIAAADAQNREADVRERAVKERAEKQKVFDQVTAEWEKFDTVVKACEAEKERLLSQAKFPIPGLGFNPSGEGVTYKGLPLEQASGAEKIRVGLAIAMALTNGLREIIIEDAALLDDQSLAIVEEMAKANDCRVWLEMITAEGEEDVVEIHDGKAVEGKRGGAVAP